MMISRLPSGEAADPAGEVVHECELALRERHFRQRAALMVRWPAGKIPIGGGCRAAGPRDERRERRGGRGDEKGRDRD